MSRNRFFVAIFTVILTACNSGPPENSAEDMVEATEYDDGEIKNQFGFYEAEQSSASNLYGIAGPSAKSIADEAAMRVESNATKADR